MRITTDIDTSALDPGLARFADKDIRFASIVARTRTVVRLRDSLNQHIGLRVDRPTRFTRRALRAVTATKARPEAEVRFKDLGFDRHYLSYLEEGGPRRAKASERLLQRAGRLLPGQFLVPGDEASLDGNGNVPRALFNVMLSDLRAQFDPRSNSTRSSRAARRRSRRRIRGTFFMVNRFLGLRDTGGLADGIYEKRPDGGLLLWFTLSNAAPRYRATLGLRRRAKLEAPRVFSTEMGAALGGVGRRRILGR